MEYVTQIVGPIGRLLELVNVDTIFGEPVREEQVTVIPVARIQMGFGYGFGRSGSLPGDGGDESDEVGGGAGGGGTVVPVGYVAVTPDGAAYVPTVNAGAIALSGIALAAWIFFVVTRTIRAFTKK